MNPDFIRWLMHPGAPEPRGTLDLRRPEWQERANCRGVGATMFVSGLNADYGALRAVCGSCAVQRECLEAALDDPDLCGLWGGTTEAERREIRRRVA
jgi:WhiB family transcriptional regulator, redox-sensing transcriptional regulator